MIQTLDHNSTFVELLKRVETIVFHGQLPGPEHDYILVDALMRTVFADAHELARIELEMTLTSVLDLFRWPPQNYLVN